MKRPTPAPSRKSAPTRLSRDHLRRTRGGADAPAPINVWIDIGGALMVQAARES